MYNINDFRTNCDREYFEQRGADVLEWRRRVEEAIKFDVPTSASDNFLVQVTDAWFVWTEKKNNGHRTYTWMQLRGKVSMDQFFWNEDIK